jgi:hypothetical protein
MSFTDAVNRISQIQAQIAAFNGAGPAPGVAANDATAAAAAGTAPAAGTSFADALSQAQAPSTVADGRLTAGQQQFASRLAQRTGLDPKVIGAWLLAEESGGAAKSRQAANNNNWLNIGYTDSGTYGASDSIWANPVTAADATAGWLQGQDTIPGYGRASAGIKAVLQTAGQPAQAQIAALQHSGWASSGYPSLPGLYQQAAP